MIFGKNQDKGIRIREFEPEVVNLKDVAEEDLLVHNEKSRASLAYLLSRMEYPEFPEPIGVFRAMNYSVYEETLHQQIEDTIRKKGVGDLHALYNSGDTWTVGPDGMTVAKPAYYRSAELLR